ncbi:MAG: hypothetical protein GXO26_01295 [Crenarchaeota archaeon]|nr:hypothetical protein [Thermoproteota archaeon]
MHVTAPQIFSIMMTHYSTYLVMFIEFLLGIGIGYAATKAAKYILALIVLIILGTLLGIWSLGISLQKLILMFVGNLDKLWSLINIIMTGLSIVMIGPVLAGIIVGVVIALLRK